MKLAFLIGGVFAAQPIEEGSTISCKHTEELFNTKLTDLTILETPAVVGVTARPYRGERPMMRQSGRLDMETSATEAAGLKLFEAGRFGTMNLEQHVKSGDDVSVYFGSRVGEIGVPFVVKHMNNCRDIYFGLPSTDVPMIREYALTEVVMSIFTDTLAPMDWISALVPLTDANKDDWGFDWDEPELLEKCIKEGGAIRTLVEHRVGVNVDSFLNHAIGALGIKTRLGMVKFLQTVLTVTRKALELLEALHATGVIHGDMHWGNLAFSSASMSLDEPNLEQLKLIDLGMAAFICGPVDKLLSPLGLNMALLSPWQLAGGRLRGFRDDVFRTLEMAAKWISFKALDSFFRLKKSDVLLAKKYLPYFGTLAPNYDSFKPARNAGVGPGTIDAVSLALSNMLQYVRKIPAFNEHVNYDFLFEELDKVDAVLKEEAALKQEAAKPDKRTNRGLLSQFTSFFKPN